MCVCVSKYSTSEVSSLIKEHDSSIRVDQLNVHIRQSYCRDAGVMIALSLKAIAAGHLPSFLNVLTQHIQLSRLHEEEVGTT